MLPFSVNVEQRFQTHIDVLLTPETVVSEYVSVASITAAGNVHNKNLE